MVHDTSNPDNQQMNVAKLCVYVENFMNVTWFKMIFSSSSFIRFFFAFIIKHAVYIVHKIIRIFHKSYSNILAKNKTYMKLNSNYSVEGQPIDNIILITNLID